jgi:K+-transporting ATPase KdpF subunit
METLTILLATSVSQNKTPMEMNSTTWFVTGIVVALLLFVYLTFTLIKPEKF